MNTTAAWWCAGCGRTFALDSMHKDAEGCWWCGGCRPAAVLEALRDKGDLTGGGDAASTKS